MTNKTKKTKPLLPYSHLVLFAKHWIEFPWLDNTKDCTEKDFYNKVATAIKMCGYYVFNRDDVLNHVLNAVDNIREEYNKYNTTSYRYPLNDYRKLVEGTQKYMRFYDITSFETAMIKYCLSELSMLSIKDFAVYNVDYRRYGLKIAHRPNSFTYSSCQKKFNEQFKDLLTIESFSNQWWIQDLKSVNIK